MDYSIAFARHFVRLVFLLLHDPLNTDEQKAALRALITIATEGFVILGVRAGQLTANGTSPPQALPGAADVVDRMTVHAIRSIDVDRNAAPADVLRVARLLAAAPAASGPVSGSSVRLTRVNATPATPILAQAPRVLSTNDPFDFGDLLGDPRGDGIRGETPAVSPSNASANDGSEYRVDTMFDQFTAARASTESHSAMFARMEVETSPARTIELLDQLAVRADELLREQSMAGAIEILEHIVRRERDAREFEVKRAFVLTVKRLTKPALLKAVVVDLARSPESRAQGIAMLARAGEDGADALIDQLAVEERRKERRLYFDALVEMQAGVPTLVHMLGDPQWFVARNAATLLGEMKARDAESALAAQLHHDDERVRHAATVALMRLGTARSLPTIQDGLRDGAPQIRMFAAAALVGRTEGNTTTLLLDALDGERDEQVAASFLAVLGRLATPDAVTRLIATAEPDKGLFRKKSVALRVAAVQALADCVSEPAAGALRVLQGDRDDVVRAAAVDALGRRARLADPA